MDLLPPSSVFGKAKRVLRGERWVPAFVLSVSETGDVCVRVEADDYFPAFCDHAVVALDGKEEANTDDETPPSIPAVDELYPEGVA